MGKIKLNIIFSDKEFYRTATKLAIPIAFQSFMTLALTIVSNVMVGSLGEKAIAGVGLANQIISMITLVILSICSGASIFIAQFWGKKEVGSIHKAMGLSLVLGVFIAFIFTLASLLFSEQILKAFTSDMNVVHLGGRFLKISAIGVIISVITFSYSFSLRSTGYVKLPMITSIIAFVVGLGMNDILIKGRLGLPEMGTDGSAVASVISRIAEVIILLYITYKNNYPAAAKIKEMMNISFDFFIVFLKTTVPAMVNECMWQLGVTIYMAAFARMGTGIIAALNITLTVDRVALVIFMGMSYTCATMIGNSIGANEYKKAYLYARRFIIIGPILGAAMGTLVIFSSSWIVSMFILSADNQKLVSSMLLIVAIFMPVRVFNTIMLNGVCRSGGDTRFPAIMETLGLWLISVPLAFIAGLYWRLPAEWVLLLVMLVEVYRFFMYIWKYLSKNWANNLIHSIGG